LRVSWYHLSHAWNIPRLSPLPWEWVDTISHMRGTFHAYHLFLESELVPSLMRGIFHAYHLFLESESAPSLMRGTFHAHHLFLESELVL
jgi:hypothetical protein